MSVNTANHALTTETPPPPTTEFYRTKKVIQIQDPDNLPPNENLAVCQTPISTSNFQMSKTLKFAWKKFESTKINYDVETSPSRKGNKTNELGDISKKTSQQNPDSKIYPPRRRLKQKILGSEPNKGIN